MKKLITIIALIPAIGYGQTWTQQMLDSSTFRFSGDGSTVQGRLDTYPDNVEAFKGGGFYTIAGDINDPYSTLVTRFSDTIKLYDYVIKPEEVTMKTE